MTAEQPQSPPPKRRWYQYSLRTLLIFMTVAGCGFGWLGIKLRKANRQAAAVHELTKIGWVYYDYQFGPNGLLDDPEPPVPAWLCDLLGRDFFCSVRIVMVETLFVSPESLRSLEELCDVEEIRLEDVNDKDLDHLKNLRNLKRLSFRQAPITDAGLERLSTLVQLKALSLYETHITGAGLATIAKCANLEGLDISANQIGDGGLSHVAQLKQLERLKIDAAQITDAGLKYVAGLSRLKYLSLHNNEISDEGLAQLEGLSNLEELRVTGISDAGLEHLKRLKHLKTLDLYIDHLTAAGEQEFKWALPNCVITRE